jgi:hypothetical protein
LVVDDVDPATVEEVEAAADDVELAPAVVVGVVDGVETIGDVVATVGVAKPFGFSTRNVETTLRAATGGRGITAPFGRNAIVIS